MRRGLLLVVGAVILVDTMFYTALAPLLPELSDELGLSKGDAGVLVGAYAVGMMVGGLPGGWISARFGARTTVLAGLALMSTAGLVFAFADSTIVLETARFIQGMGGACAWVGGLAWVVEGTSRERRSEALGIAIGAGIFGAQFGPALGSLASAVGRDVAFAGAALAGLVLAVVALRTPTGIEEVPESQAPPMSGLRDRRFLVALWITTLPAIAFGVIEVLVPLRLDHLGASALLIGGVFFVAAFFEALVSPVVGRIADRRGSLVIVRAGMLGAAVVVPLLAVPGTTTLLALVLVVSGITLGALWVPGGTLISHRADTLDIDQGWAFAFNNLGWAAGVGLGSVAGGALAEAFGDEVPYALVAGLLLATGVAALARRPERPLRSAA